MVVEPSDRIPEFVVDRFRAHDESELRDIVTYLTRVGNVDSAGVPDYVIELEALQDEKTVTDVAEYAWKLAEAEARPLAMTDGSGVEAEDEPDGENRFLDRLRDRLRTLFG